MIERVIRFSQWGYYLSFLLVVVAAFAGYFSSRFIHLDKSSESGIAFQSFVFLLMLGSLPGILWWFHRKAKEMRDCRDDEKESRYKRLVVLRLFVVDFNMALNILLFFLFADKSFFMCAAIAAIVLLFCRPNQQNIETDLGIADAEPDDEEAAMNTNDR
ncbi:MAG: hypothetical protein H6Q17_1035 [Bacteroidetes bacterium]|jgi:hypothetical protein|nr:hypothetical protein [Bacteroidota bacterium]